MRLALSDWPSAELEPIERRLYAAEHQIRLLDRLRPQNFAAERTRIVGALRAGEWPRPRFVYAAAPELEPLRAELSQLSEQLRQRGAAPHELLAERAAELALEAELVLQRGRRAFRTLSAERYPLGASELERADALCRAWLTAPQAEPTFALSRSDDERDDNSLVSVLRARVRASGLAVTIRLNPELASTAAAGEGFVVIRPNVWLSAQQAARIAEHELFAHVLPRLRAQREPSGLFRVGVRGAGEDEEGRALCLEQRAGHLDAARGRELALRHLAASAVRADATFSEVVRLLLAHDVDIEAACDGALRALRGGGLGREITYVPAFVRLSGAFATNPELEGYFERGRVSLDLARVLAAIDGQSLVV